MTKGPTGRPRGRPRKTPLPTSGAPPALTNPASDAPLAPEALLAQTEAIEHALRALPRDDLGFAEGDTPNLTEQQVAWLLERLGVATDLQANALTGVSDQLLTSWRALPGFLAVYNTATTNKREGFRLLGTQLLYKALRRSNWLMDQTDSPRAVKEGITLLLRSQGMLIDAIKRDRATEAEQLLILLRQQSEVRVNTMPPVEGAFRELPPGEAT